MVLLVSLRLENSFKISSARIWTLVSILMRLSLKVQLFKVVLSVVKRLSLTASSLLTLHLCLWELKPSVESWVILSPEDLSSQPRNLRFSLPIKMTKRQLQFKSSKEKDLWPLITIPSVNSIWLEFQVLPEVNLRLKSHSKLILTVSSMSALPRNQLVSRTKSPSPTIKDVFLKKKSKVNILELF